tara:strand:+ start:64 stop:225 length:162 start_codon:yes stop_codon:yes gene_type:complete
MSDKTELEELESELLVANDMARFWVKADARAWAKAEVSRIKAKIVKLKEQDND